MNPAEDPLVPVTQAIHLQLFFRSPAGCSVTHSTPLQLSEINAKLFLGSDIANIKGKLIYLLPPSHCLNFNIICLQHVFAKYHTSFSFLTSQYRCYFNMYFLCLSLRAETISCTCLLSNLSRSETEDRATLK